MATNLSSLYLSLNRLSEILPYSAFSYSNGAAVISDVPNDDLQRLRLLSSVERAFLQWLIKSKLPTLGELLVTGFISAGDFFTYFGRTSGKGTLAAATQYWTKKFAKTEARLKIDLKAFRPTASMVLQVHPENYTSSSSAVELSGSKRLFLVGRVTESEAPAMRAQAYLIGHLHTQIQPEPEPESSRSFADPFDRLPFGMEVYLSTISPFDQAIPERMASQAELEKLQSIREADVKAAFAEIVGEPFVPKDSPSETSDLQTHRLWLARKQVSAAFTFKGRGLRGPLTPGNFGKHGTQINKLFTEPVDLVVVQHCNKVTNDTRHSLRAFATRVHQLRPFLIIDGNDTVRILRHFRKLGFS